MNIRWYAAQLEFLPPDSKKKMTLVLRRMLRTRALPSRREWLNALRRVAGEWSF